MTVWRTVSPGEFRWQACDDGAVLFHRASGATHYLDAAAEEIVRLLCEAPRTTEALAGELAAQLETASDANLFSYVETLLERLSVLGLVLRVAPAKPAREKRHRVSEEHRSARHGGDRG